MMRRALFLCVLACGAVLAPSYGGAANRQMYVIQTSQGPIFGYEENGYFEPCPGSGSRIPLADPQFKNQKPQPVPGDCTAPSPTPSSPRALSSERP